ncbi:MAG: hypothetical protein M1829_003657 [Trizodia sp. TS-e1964]|nr:MAG: hypothetical protein M1829_003657 [Trizodia sp. TS-e1964]
MAKHAKRPFVDFDPNKSDSNDEDWDAKEDARSNNNTRARNTAKPPPKKRKKKHDSDDDEDDDEIVDETEDDISQNEISEPEIDAKTGRPRRKAAQKTVKYEESEEDADPPEEPPEEEAKPLKRTLRVTLKVGAPKKSRTSARTQSAEPTQAPTRRSHRLHHDETEAIYALTDSGRHATEVRSAKQSPESKNTRPIRGGKGLKRPTADVVVEENEAETEEAIVAEQIREISEEVEDIQDRVVVSSSNPDVANQVEPAQVQDNNNPNVNLTPPPDEEEGTPEGASASEAIVIREEIPEDDDDDDDDDEPISRGRNLRGNKLLSSAADQPSALKNPSSRAKRSVSGRSAKQKRKSTRHERSSDVDFRPEESSDEELSNSETSQASPRKDTQQDDDSANTRQTTRGAKGKKTSGNANKSQRAHSDEHDSEEAEEIAEELQELKKSRTRRQQAPLVFESNKNLRSRRPVNYQQFWPPPDVLMQADEADAPAAPTPTRRGRGGGGAGGGYRSLFSVQGPFGGAGGPPAVFGGPWGTGAIGGVDSDSSDDERMQHPPGVGGNVGMTPTSAAPPGLLPPTGQALANDPTQVHGGTPANFGKIKSRHALADADPLGVDQNIDFSSVGGLQDHINQLKEMVSLPLLYPEIFQRFHVTPPRGVLFHGPPGTGKTLLARALAASVSSGGRKITFYMRKGADALSKWVGEAERQLRLLFEEARNNQPSIIFFDEIDGLAPVRSSKQEQIHASIVSTLLALMDGMDGRGQVIVIGATNRPDSIDPALRRPGRFDREFYFPLPGTEARRTILDIHTKSWNPGLSNAFKDQLAELTKGYGGADLRALCTEAALNAVQRRYPQIYTSNEKLVIDPTTIDITAKDFMISIKKLIPSSERSASSGASPIPKHLEALLEKPLAEIKKHVACILPQKKKLTALEEAQFEDYADEDGGFQREKVQQAFETSRIFRPRLLVSGSAGMGQHYLAAALLNHFEGLHVQSFDLPTLLSDSTRSTEAAVVQLFTEVKRHKPSVIYIPNVNTWYNSLAPTTVSTFLGLLRTLPSTDPVLLLGIMEKELEPTETDATQPPLESPDLAMIKDLFGFSKKNIFEVTRPDRESRYAYFGNVVSFIRKSPEEFPDPSNRKKRKIEKLSVCPPAPPKPPTKEQLKAQKARDRQILNLLKIRIQPIMDQLKLKYKKFRTGVIDYDRIRYLYDEGDPNQVASNINQFASQEVPADLATNRPFEKGFDKDGVEGLVEKSTQKFYYNRDIVMIEERLSNGWYKRPKDFLAEISYLAKDAKNLGDRDRQIKANEMLANVEVDIGLMELDPTLADCENVYIRERQRAEEKKEKLARQLAAERLATAADSSLNAISNASNSAIVATPIIPAPKEPLFLGGPITPFPQAFPNLMPNGNSLGALSQVAVVGGSSLRNGSSAFVISDSDGDIRMSDAGGTTEPISNPSRMVPHLLQQGSMGSENGAGHPPATSNMGPPTQVYSESQFTHFTQHSQQPASGPRTSATNTQFSQKRTVTAMPLGSQIEDFVNSASTTTSGKKTGDTSDRSFEPHPLWAAVDENTPADTQLPDTQENATSSQNSGPQAGSQAPGGASHTPPVPAFNAPSRHLPRGLGPLLNSPKEHPPFLIDEKFVEGLHAQFTDRTSGSSVEQLEQINTALMDCVWRMREEWNRTRVCTEVARVFNETMQDIEHMQQFLPASWPRA